MTATSAENMKYFAVTMMSLAFNNPTRHLHFFVVHTGADPKTVSDMEAVADRVNADLDFIYFDKAEVSDFRYQNNSYPLVIMASCMPHLVLPADIDKVLYLGTDVIVNGDISDLYDSDLGDNVFGGCRILSGFKRFYLDPKNNDCFECRRLNLDMMLIDLNKLRSEGIDIAYYKDLFWSRTYQSKFYYANPEHLINVAFEHRITYFWEGDYNYRVNVKPIFDQISKRINKPVRKTIIHYVGWADRLIDKPWDGYFEDDEPKLYCALKAPDFDTITANTHELYKIWWKYAKMTPLYEQLRAEADRNVAVIRRIYSRIGSASQLKNESRGYHLIADLIIKDIPSRIIDLLGDKEKKLAFYFNSLITRSVIKLIDKSKVQIIGIIQENGGNQYDGIPLFSPLSDDYADADAVIICFYNNEDPIIKQVKETVRNHTKEDCKVFTIQDFFD